jgi:serine/threonine protein kinase
VHRDVKPANLFLTREGTVKVLDFGIARLRDAASGDATHTGMLLGTPAFMAPEQAQGLTNIDGQTDVWAAAATMFTLIAGETVHVGDNAQQIMIRAATQPARSLRSIVPGASLQVTQVVDRGLASERAERWPSAAVMRDAVRDAYGALFGQPVTVQPLTALFDNQSSSNPRASNILPVRDTPSPSNEPPLPTPAAISATTAQPISGEVAERFEVPRSRPMRSLGLALASAVVLGLFAVAVVRLRESPPTPTSAPISPASETAAVTLAPASDSVSPASASASASSAPLPSPGTALPGVRTGSRPVAPRPSVAPAVPSAKPVPASAPAHDYGL